MDFSLYYSISSKPMVTNGVETILGVQRDPVFGPVVLFGLGGIFVEMFKAWHLVRRHNAVGKRLFTTPSDLDFTPGLVVKSAP